MKRTNAGWGTGALLALLLVARLAWGAEGDWRLEIGEYGSAATISTLQSPISPRTEVSLAGGKWRINGRVTYPGARAEGLLMNVRMVNATYEDRNRPEFDPEANTTRFIRRIPEYKAHGVLAFTLCLQGGFAGYEGALNSAFEADGSLRPEYLRRVERVIDACDREGMAVILGCYYQRQAKLLRDDAAIHAGVVDAARWVVDRGFRNVVLEVANEYSHPGFAQRLLRSPEGEAELVRLAKRTAPRLLVSTSGLGGGTLDAPVAAASDFLLIHFNSVPPEGIPARVAALRAYRKAIVCNEDADEGEVAARAAELSVANGISWGLMLEKHNQHFPFHFDGAADDPVVYAKLKELTTPGEGKGAAPAGGEKAVTLPRLRVSDNHRFLVTEDGKPFFYLGDTAWELFHRLNREEADRYLKDRAEKGFTVIQAVVLAELDGLRTPNAYGHAPLKENDPRQPDDEYFRHVDWIVNRANELGLRIGMLPTWGDKWHAARGAGPVVFNTENARAYGEWLGRRYRDSGVIWILGGDRRVETDEHRAVIEAMARGLRAGDGGAHLITFHPPGGAGSSQWFHDADWLDFNMRQNGHVPEFNGRYDQTRLDYDRQPVKPVLDGEPLYEDHPVSFRAAELGHSTAADVRRPLYWDLFSGACGHTYGHHSVWQMWQPGRSPVNNPLMPWQEALDQPGAAQMQHGRHLLESRPFLTRIPDDEVIVTDRVPTAVPGAGRYRYVATRDADGSYAMVYAPLGRPFSVRMEKITGPRVKAWWFNPRDGKATPIGEFPNQGPRQFTPPDKGETLDWVLVLDDASKNYPPPGQPAIRQ